MTLHSLPTGATVLTRSGPNAAGSLRGGDAVLGTRNGKRAWANVVEVTQRARPASVARLLTPGGEVLVEAEARVGTPRGLRPVGELEAGGRLELLEPPSLPRFESPGRRLKMLEGITFTLPSDNGCADAVEPALSELLSKARAESVRRRAGRWLAVGIKRVGNVSSWSWDDHADLLSLLCAWEATDGTPTEMRAADSSSTLSHLLLDALTGARRRFVASWTPKFLPMELRTTLSPSPWQGYVPISLAARERQPITQLAVMADGWSIISGLAPIRSEVRGARIDDASAIAPIER